MIHLLTDVSRESGNKVMIQIFPQKFVCCRMNSVSSLMECIFPIDVMEYLSNTYTVSCGDNCFFVILVFIFSKWLLRTDKKWITATLNCIISVARPG